MPYLANTSNHTGTSMVDAEINQLYSKDRSTGEVLKRHFDSVQPRHHHSTPIPIAAAQPLKRQPPLTQESLQCLPSVPQIIEHAFSNIVVESDAEPGDKRPLRIRKMQKHRKASLTVGNRRQGSATFMKSSLAVEMTDEHHPESLRYHHAMPVIESPIVASLRLPFQQNITMMNEPKTWVVFREDEDEVIPAEKIASSEEDCTCSNELVCDSGTRPSVLQDLVLPPRTNLDETEPPPILMPGSSPDLAASGSLLIPRPVAEISAFLQDIFLDEDKHQKLLSYRHKPAQHLLDVLLVLLNYARLAERLRRIFLMSLLEFSWEFNLPPSRFDLSGVTREGEYPLTEGHFGEIYKGRLQSRVVCIKYSKIYDASSTALLHKAFAREAILWSQLSHTNILPFYGIHRFGDTRNRIGLVSPWMKNGNLNEFLKKNPDTDRSSLVADVAAGLLYLHNNGFVHGDLAGTNILVNGSERACIAGLDLFSVVQAHGLPASETPLGGGTIRYQAPELIDPDCECSRSMSSDVYAFGMVCYLIFTSNHPFPDVKHDFTVLLKVLQGERPTRPPDPSCVNRGLTDAVWEQLGNCWQHEPDDRPVMSQVVAQLPIIAQRHDEGWGDPSVSQAEELDHSSYLLLDRWATEILHPSQNS